MIKFNDLIDKLMNEYNSSDERTRQDIETGLEGMLSNLKKGRNLIEGFIITQEEFDIECELLWEGYEEK